MRTWRRSNRYEETETHPEAKKVDDFEASKRWDKKAEVPYWDLDNLPAMTTEAWAKFFGVSPDKIHTLPAVEAEMKAKTIGKFFSIIYDITHETKA